MSQTSNLKRQLLRQAVADNISTQRGEPRPRRPAARVPPRRSSWHLALAFGLILALSATFLVLRRAPTAQATAPDLTPSPAAAAIEPQEEPRFAAPQPIDSDVFPLEVRHIVLDPGHGGDDFGTVDNDLAEKELTLDIAGRLAKLLRKADFEVTLTREDDRKLSLKDRAAMANDLHSDLFVSIHVNWMGHRQVRGVETYFLGATEDPELKELVRRENRESGYSLGDMKLLLEGIYTGVRRDASRQFASSVQRTLFSSLQQVNPQLKNRGVKTAPFVVLVSTEMPAILAEVSCLSNREEARLLSRPLYRDHIAEALFRGIKGYADDVHQTEEKGS
ncbi:MAG: N-acetylmuramoyl-L-alanine amidase [Acidobacteriota bacterium]